MFDLWASGNSVLREKVVEHVFLAELSKALLLRMSMPFEVLRAEFDAHGYDLVLEAGGNIRHVQLKAMRAGGKRSRVNVSLELARKPSGCVIWHVVDEATLELGPFYWLGGAPGEPLPSLGERVSRHTRANATGLKAERQGLREVRLSKFTQVDSIDGIARALFGPGLANHQELLSNHLLGRGIQLDDIKVPDQLSWRNSAEIAHMIDGYALAEIAGLGDPREYRARARRDAELTGRWSGSPLELWVALFLEHRRDHFSGAIGIDIGYEDPPILDTLAATLVQSLRSPVRD